MSSSNPLAVQVVDKLWLCWADAASSRLQQPRSASIGGKINDAAQCSVC